MSGNINFTTIKEVFRSGNFGAILLFFSVLLSLALANSPLQKYIENLLDYKIGFEYNSVELRYSLLLWINDGLMSIFFLLVGLEIKREILKGSLSSIKTASLPILCAIGGAVLPALAYLSLNSGSQTSAGWGIPMATDIAFAMAVIGILGNRIPQGIKVFLIALAIVDDLIAVLVIAAFYSSGIELIYLFYAAFGLSILFLMNRFGVKNPYLYLIPGAFIWYFVHHSGIHATISGVLVAFTIPANRSSTESPLERLEHCLVKPVNLLIIPIFAFANTNISFDTSVMVGLTSQVGLGISLGLLVGKPIGIVLFAFLGKILGISRLPDNSGWRDILGVGFLAGIGFTMSIFIALLSFDEIQHISHAKMSILVSSLVAGILGFLLLKKPTEQSAPGSKLK